MFSLRDLESEIARINAQEPSLHQAGLYTWAPWDWSPETYCDEAFDKFSRLSEELRIARSRSFIGDTIIFDCEQQISECVDRQNRWFGNLGVFELSEWNTDSVCPIDQFNQASYVAILEGIFINDTAFINDDDLREQIKDVFPESCNKLVLPNKFVPTASLFDRTWDFDTLEAEISEL